MNVLRGRLRLRRDLSMVSCVGLEPLKVRHDVTNLDFIVSLLSLLCIDIDLIIQPILFTFYMT